MENQGRLQELSKVGPDGERAEREPIVGVWGGAPAGSRAQPLVRRSP